MKNKIDPLTGLPERPNLKNEIDALISRQHRDRVGSGISENLSQFEVEEANRLNTPIMPGNPDMRKEIMAQNQSGWSLAGRAIAQAAGEVVFGTLEGAGYLLDFENYNSVLTGAETDFGNWFSNYFKEAKESFNEESVPIYKTQAAEGFNPGDATWWASNFPTLASSLSLLIPATGAAKIGTWAAKSVNNFARGRKGLQALKTATQSKTANALIDGVQGGVYSRLMENTLESTGIYEETYNEALQKGMSEQDATSAASKAASNTWKANMVLLATDIPQFLSLSKGMNWAKGIANGSKKTKEGIRGTLKELGFQMGSEGAEEIYQYIAGQESRLSALGENDKTFAEKVIDYSKDGELWTSAFWGAVGGGVFSAGGKQLNNLLNKRQQRTQLRELEKIKASYLGDYDRVKSLQDEEFIDLYDTYSNLGKVEELESHLDELIEEAQSKEDQETVDTLSNYKKYLPEINDIFNSLSDDAALSNTNKSIITKLHLKNRLNGDRISSINNSLNQRYVDSGLSAELQQVKKLYNELEAAKSSKSKEEIDNLKTNLNTVLESIKSKAKENGDTSLDTYKKIKSKVKGLDNRVIRKSIRERNRLEKEFENNIEVIEKFDNLEFREKMDEIHNSIRESFSARESKAIQEELEGAEDVDLEAKKIAAREKAEENLKAEIEQKAQEEKERRAMEKASNQEDTEDYSSSEDPWDGAPPPGVNTLGFSLTTEKAAEDKKKAEVDRQGGVEYDTAPIEAKAIEEYNKLVNGVPEHLIAKIFNPFNINSKEEFISEVVNRVIEDAETGSSEANNFIISLRKERKKVLTSATTKHEASSNQEVDEDKEMSPPTSNQNSSDTSTEITQTPKVSNASNHIVSLSPDKKVSKAKGVSYDKSGMPEDHDLREALPIDNNLLNYELHSYSNLNTGEVYLEMTVGDIYKEDPDTAKIAIVIYHDPVNKEILNKDSSNENKKRSIVGYLPTVQNSNSIYAEKLQKLRATAFRNYAARSANSTIITSPDVLKIDSIYLGNIFRTSKGNNSISEVIEGRQDKLILGVGVSSNEIDYNEANTEEIKELELVYTGLNQKILNGSVWALIRVADGRYVPVNLRVPRLKEMPEKLKEIENIVRSIEGNEADFKKNWRVYRDKIHDIVRFKKNNTFVPYMNSKLVDPNHKPTAKYRRKDGTFNPEAYLEMLYSAYDLENRVLQVHTKKLNQGSYNETLGRILTVNMPKGQTVHSASLQLSTRENSNTSPNTNQTSSTPKKESPIQERKGSSLLDRLSKKASKGEIKPNIPDIPKNSSTRLSREEMNEAEERAWFKERFPSIPYFIVKDLKKIHKQGADAWGMFYKAAVFIKEKAYAGVTFHEAFHVVFNLLLSDTQQDIILNEAYERYGKEEGITKKEFEEALRDKKANEILFSKDPSNSSIDYNLKAIDILQSDKAIEIFEKGKKNGWDLNKILTELQISKEQKQIILDKYKNDLFHTGENLTLENVSVEPRKTRQGKKGKYGGLYTYSNLEDIYKFQKGNNTKNIFGIKLKPNVEIKEYTGSIERLDKDKLDSLRAKGYQVIRGKSLFGREEIVIIDKNAIKSITNQSNIREEIITSLLADNTEVREITLPESISNNQEENYILSIVNALDKFINPVQGKRFRKYKERKGVERQTLRLNTREKPNIETNIRKVLQGKGVTNPQIDLLFDYMKQNNLKEISVEDAIKGLKEQYQFVVEINTAKGGSRILDTEFNQVAPEWMADDFLDSERIEEENNTSFYSNLSAPGDTKGINKYKDNPDWEYLELEIATPAITPSIKGHAQFSTDNGIGWVRVWVNKKTGVVEIQEIQSDLFQKGRGRKDLVNNYYKFKREKKLIKDKYVLDPYNGYRWMNTETFLPSPTFETKDKANKWLDNQLKIELEKFNKLFELDKINNVNPNQFLQLLNKKNNWVTFFVKSIIQDSAKKGYEKVLFPKGDTAAKIEGHQTLEEFKKEKESRIKELESKIGQNFKLGNIYYHIRGGIAYKEDRTNYDTMEKGRTEVSFEEYESAKKEYLKDNKPVNENYYEIERLKQELADVESGQTKLSSIADFYEITITNILKKQGFNPVEITDEYGNKWSEVKIDSKHKEKILLSTPKKEHYKDQGVLVRLEERLADDLANYVNKAPKSKSIKGYILRFFRKLMNIINNIIGRKSEIDNLFYKIQYKPEEIRNWKPSNLLGGENTRFSKDKKSSLTPSQRKEFRTWAIAQFLQKMELQDSGNKEYRKKISDALSSDINKNIILSEDNPDSIIMTLFNEYQNASEEQKPLLLHALNELDGFNSPLFIDIINNLTLVGIDVQIKGIKEDKTKIDLLEPVEEPGEIERWMFNVGDISTENSASQFLRAFTNTIPVLIRNSEGVLEHDTNQFGLVNYYPKNVVFKKLQKVLANSISEEEMMTRLLSQAESDPMFRSVYSRLNDKAKKNLWLSIGQTRHKTSKDFIDSDGRVVVLDSNFTSTSKALLEDFKQGFNNPITNSLMSKDGTIPEAKKIKFYEKFSKFRDSLQLLDVSGGFPIEIFQELQDIFNEIGISIPEEAMDIPGKDLKRTVVKNLNQFASDLVTYDNPFSPSDTKKISSIQKFTYALQEVLPQSSTDAHRNADNNTEYEYVEPNFILDTILNIKNNLENFRLKYDNKILTSGLELFDRLTSNPKFLKKLEYFKFNFFQEKRSESKKGYADLTEADLLFTMLTGYINSSKDTGLFIPTIFSDASELGLIELPKVFNLDSGSGSIISTLTDLVNKQILEISKAAQNNSTELKKMRNTLQTIAKTKTLPIFKYVKYDLVYDKKEEKYIIPKPPSDQEIADAIRMELEEAKQEIISKLQIAGFIKKNTLGDLETKTILPKGQTLGDVVNEFVHNHVLNQYQLSLITTGSISRYTDVNDFFKRAKEIHSPGSVGSNDLKWNGKSIRQVPFIGVSVINDVNNTKDPYKFQLKEIEEKVQILLDSRIITKSEAEKIKNKFKGGVELTDGQSYIDIYTQRLIEISYDTWNDEKESVFKKIMAGEWDTRSEKVLFPPNKPFYYNLHESGDSLLPFQNKDSEFVLIPQMAKWGPEFRDLLEKMGWEFDDNNNIKSFNEKDRNWGLIPDKISFSSTIKAEEARQMDKDGNPIVHKLELNKRRKQGVIPVGERAKAVTLGTQFAKHMLTNLPDELAHLIPEINQLLIDKIKISYDKLAPEIKDFDSLINLLKNEVIKRGLGSQYIEALDKNEDRLTYDEVLDSIEKMKELNLPLFHPLHSYRIESMLSSLFKNNVTKLKMTNGKSLVNLSSYGFKDTPKIKFKENGGIEHFEAYVSMDLLPKEYHVYLNEDGTIREDRPKSFDRLLEGIMYRIPTEDKYSIFHVKVAKFLPTVTGKVIALPPEITSIAGLDFDIDKMFGFFHTDKSSPTTKIENELLDKYKQILQHPTTTKNYFLGGSFQSLEDHANEIEKKKNQNKSETSVFNPVTTASVGNRMMTGAKLIGIGANWLASKALWQISKGPLFIDSSIFALKVDGNLKNNLKTNVDSKENLIISNMAEDVASFVDHGKNPLSDKYNMNTYTANVAFMLKSLGVPSHDVRNYLSQPSLEYLSKLYFQLGGNKDVETKMKEMLEKHFNVKINLKDTLSVEINTSKLESLNTPATKDNVDINIIKDFLKLYEVSNTISRFVSATKNADSGAGPTFAETKSKIDLRTASKQNSLLVGADQFLEDESIYINSLFKYGIEQALKDVAYLGFPDLVSPRSAFKRVTDSFRMQSPESILSPKEINFIIQNMLDFAISKFDLFSSGNFDKLQITKDIGTHLLEYRTNNPNNKFSPFINKLQVVHEGESTFIELRGLTGATEQEIDDFRVAWYEMYLSPIKQEHLLAKNLIRTSFYTSGFRLQAKALGSLQPISFYSNIKDSDNRSLSEKLVDSVNYSNRGLGNASSFMKLFVENFYPGLSYIQEVAPSKIEVVKSYKNFPVQITIDEKAYSLKDLELPHYVKFNGYLYELDYSTNVYKYVKKRSTFALNKSGKPSTSITRFIDWGYSKVEKSVEETNKENQSESTPTPTNITGNTQSVEQEAASTHPEFDTAQALHNYLNLDLSGSTKTPDEIENDEKC